MFVNAIKMAKAAMFPIFRMDQISPSELRVAVVGAGFFINSNGYFISVAHIFEDIKQGTSFNYLGQVPDHVQNPPIKIEEVVKDDEYDIFVGKIDVKNKGFFYLTMTLPDIGKDRKSVV